VQAVLFPWRPLCWSFDKAYRDTNSRTFMKQTKDLIRIMTMAAIGWLTAASAWAGVVLTYENPGVEQTTVVGASTETFDSVPLGPLANYSSAAIGGTYNGGEIVVADQYGGAGGSQYDVVGLGQSTLETLTFTSDKTYFGLWWSAGDAANELQFKENGALVASFKVGDVVAAISGNPAYYGNPSGPFAGQNSAEPYVYLNFTGTGGTVFDEVDFLNPTGSGFESDNHSVYDQPITPPGNPVPDAGWSLEMLGGAMALLAAYRRSKQ
jgi:hypothetical protein